MFAPVIVIDNDVPAWVSHLPTGLVKDIYDQMAKPDVKMINKANVLLDRKSHKGFSIQLYGPYIWGYENS